MKSSVLKIVLLTVLLISTTALFASDSTRISLKKDVPRGEEIRMTWELKGIDDSKRGYNLGYRSKLVIKNLSNQIFNGSNWAIYFHQPMPVKAGSETGNVKITHVNGDYYKIEPTAKFTRLKQGEECALEYLSNFRMIKMQGAPTGFYIVYSDRNENEYKPENILDVRKVLIRSEQTTLHANDHVPYPTGAHIYAKNEAINHLIKDSLSKIIPTPYQTYKQQGSYSVEKELSIAYHSDFKNEAEFLAEKLIADIGLKVNVFEGDSGSVVLVKRKMESKFTGIGSYELKISNDGISIYGWNPTSIFYGVQSLRAIIPVEAYLKKVEEITLNNVFIHDEARFEYRGMHLDVARNFNSKETVFKLLDLMAFYKLNKFHFHITDDEGWRLEIPGLPELTDVGAKRGHTTDEMDMLMPALGSGPFSDDVDSYGSGYYTTSDFIEILEYAKARHIEVIPELDFPGHARAAIVSMKSRYEKLLQKGKKRKAKKYMLHDPKDGSRYRTVQRFNDNVVCPCRKSTYRFIEKVVDEVEAMYKLAGLKLENLHIGGDEVPHPMGDDPDHGAWRFSPICNEFLKKHEAYDKPEELYYYFVDQLSLMLEGKGIKVAGWEEVAMKKSVDAEGDYVIENNQEFKARGVVPYTWNNIWGWGGEDRAYKLANDGYKVVIAGASNNYYALAYDKNPMEPGYYWGGFVDTKRSWQQVPLNIYNEDATTRDGNPITDYKQNKTRLTEEGAKNIKGIQGQMWSETLLGEATMEYCVFPKILGLVERTWSKDPLWTSIEKDSSRVAAQDEDWSDFASRLGYFELPRLTYLNGGVKYRIAAPGVIVEDSVLKVNMNYPGFVCKYTTDGSEPNASSIVYTNPVKVWGRVVKVIAFNAKGDKSLVTEVFIDNRIMEN